MRQYRRARNAWNEIAKKYWKKYWRKKLEKNIILQYQAMKMCCNKNLLHFSYQTKLIKNITARGALKFYLVKTFYIRQVAQSWLGRRQQVGVGWRVGFKLLLAKTKWTKMKNLHNNCWFGLKNVSSCIMFCCNLKLKNCAAGYLSGICCFIYFLQYIFM